MRSSLSVNGGGEEVGLSDDGKDGKDGSLGLLDVDGSLGLLFDAWSLDAWSLETGSLEEELLFNRTSKVSARAGASVFVVGSVGVVEAVSLLVSLLSISSASFVLAGFGVSRSVVVGVPSSGLEMDAEVDSDMGRGIVEGFSVAVFVSAILAFLPLQIDPAVPNINLGQIYKTENF